MERRRRIGCFRIDREVLENRPLDIMAAMQKCIVVFCQYSFSQQCFEYHAWGPDFDETGEGDEIPKYDLVVDVAECSVRFVRRAAA